MSWGIDISGGHKMVGLRWASDCNEWMDCVIYTPKEYEQAAAKAIKSGVDLFWEENDLCYGDCIEEKLIEADIPFFAEYFGPDSDEGTEYLSWETHLDLLVARGVPIIDVLV